MQHSIRPRYTPGSPSYVSPAVAAKVLLEETAGYQRALAGRHGPEANARARRLGLAGIVETVADRRGKLEIRDLITGDLATQTVAERRRQIASRV